MKVIIPEQEEAKGKAIITVKELIVLRDLVKNAPWAGRKLSLGRELLRKLDLVLAGLRK